VEAIELYRKANRNTEAAKLLIKITKDMSHTTTSPILLKKISVMSALEVDSYKTRVFQAQLTGQMTTAQTLDSLITSDINTMSDKTLDNPWRGAEAYHFYLMAQRQLYDGEYEEALKTAIRLQEYENVLETKDIYSIVALAAYYSKFYGECSKALVKLENLQGLSEEEREAYAELAVSIFSRHPPHNPAIRGVPCPGKSCSSKVLPYDTNCADCGVNFPACIASGRPILERVYAQCKACKHKMIEQEVQKLGVQHCPLCHSVLRLTR
jgi:WD repeat-containing protein 35